MRINLLLMVLLSLLTFSCSVESDEDPLDVYREIAYNALSSSQKSTVVGEWKDAEVGAWTNGNYVVIFQTTDAVLGPIRVVVDPDLGVVLEILPRP